MGEIGERLRVGYTIGEEILFEEAEEIYRKESCVAVGGEAALLQINADDLISMSAYKHLKGGGTSLIKDFQVLMGVLLYNFDEKQLWRCSH